MPTVTINDQPYDLDSLSDAAKKQLQNLSICDQKIQQLQAELAITKTARGVYAKTLESKLPEQNKTKKVKTDKTPKEK